MKLVTLSLIAFLGFQQLGFGISGGKIIEKTKSDSLNNAILRTTGILRMIDSDPIQIKSNHIGYNSKIETASCTAIFIKKPAWFITSAGCFINEEGRFEKFRTLARIWIEGKDYKIDPRTVILHEKHVPGKVTNDIAIFSINESYAASFGANRTPMKIVPKDTWLVSGHPVTMAAFGGTNDAGENFGVGRMKSFALRDTGYPYLFDTDSKLANLFVRPTEQAITYESREGVGVNCRFDSGGPILVSLMDTLENTKRHYLQSIIAGSVGPDGDMWALCDKISKYALGLDLRFHHDWIDQAIEKAKANIAKDNQAKSDYFAGVNRLYKNNQFSAWAPTRPEGYKLLDDLTRNKTFFEKSKAIYKYMKPEEMRYRAHTVLGQTKDFILEESWETFKTPTDPFPPKYSDWIQLKKVKESELTQRLRKLTGEAPTSIEYMCPDTTKWTGNFRIQNVGPTTISFDKAEARGSRSPSWNNVKIDPGHSYDLWLNGPKSMTLNSFHLEGYKGHQEIKIYLIPSVTYTEIKYDGNNVYTIRPPRLYEIRNDAPRIDVNYIKLWNRNGYREPNLELKELTVHTAYDSSGKYKKSYWWQDGSGEHGKKGHMILYPQRWSGYKRFVKSGTDEGAWWNLYSIEFLAFGEGTFNMTFYVDFKD